MNDFHQELDDLYKLQAAARELVHGIQEDGQTWKLYEPSRFIYAFFAFNSFYSINWDDSVRSCRIVQWNENDENKKQSAQICAMTKFIYNTLTNRVDLNKSPTKEAGAKFIEVFKGKYGKYNEASVEEILTKLDRIETDHRITQVQKEKFLDNISIIFKAMYANKQYADALYDVLYFIYNVRNNIFHGTKTILDMMGRHQRKRLDVYTALLLAVNDLLFDAIVKNTRWEGKELIDHQLENKRTRNNRHNTLRTVASEFALNIPKGALFYPCCGNDTLEPILKFMDVIEEFHFVDAHLVPTFPTLTRRKDGNRIENEPSLSYKGRIIPSEVKSIKEDEHYEQKIDDEITTDLESRDLKAAGFKGQPSKIYIQKWTLRNGNRITIKRHVQDGLVTFLTVNNISVFFLRGDSEGEGGSRQRWFSENLFRLIIEKLLPGGLIVTDGSSIDIERYSTSPLRNLWKNTLHSNREVRKTPASFAYENYQINFIGEFSHSRSSPTYIWQVIKET